MKNKNILSSFKYAFEGIISSFKSERNMKIHFCFMILVCIMGIFFKISATEWVACILCFMSVIGAELFNTAIEETVDIATQEKQPKAKLAKDVSAGAVLFFTLGSIIIGSLVFLPKIISFFIK